jgi:hypothetical protein
VGPAEVPQCSEINSLECQADPSAHTDAGKVLGQLSNDAHPIQSKHRSPQRIGRDGAARVVDPLVLIASPSLETDGRQGSSGRGLLFDACLEGGDRVLVRRTHQPFLDACRVLVDDGVDPTTRIVMRHAGSHTDSLIAKVGAAAKLSVKEDDEPPRFRAWTPFPSRPVESSVRFEERAARGIADDDQNAPPTPPGANGEGIAS